MTEAAKSKRVGSFIFRCAPEVSWAVEGDGIILIRQDREGVIKLGYPQSAVWDLITQHYPFDKMISLVSAIDSSDDSTSIRIVAESLREWVNAGLLISERVYG